MTKTVNQHRKDIVEIGKRIYQLGHVAAFDGNISVRLEDGNILSTPTAMSKGFMTEDDLVIVDFQGNAIEGKRKVSSEIGMHLLIYQLRPDVHGIVHAHPPCATGYAAAGVPLQKAILAEVVLVLGCVPLTQYGTTGTSELADAIREFIPHHDALLLANHGVVAYGSDLFLAHAKMETVEHFARISLTTKILGSEKLLSNDDVDKLIIARERYGVKGSFSVGEECPTTLDTESESRITLTKRELVDMIQLAVTELRSKG